LEGGVAGKDLSHIKLKNPEILPILKWNTSPNDLIPKDGSTSSALAFNFLANSRVSVPYGAAVVLKATGSDPPPATQLTILAVFTST